MPRDDENGRRITIQPRFGTYNRDSSQNDSGLTASECFIPTNRDHASQCRRSLLRVGCSPPQPRRPGTVGWYYAADRTRVGRNLGSVSERTPRA